MRAITVIVGLILPLAAVAQEPPQTAPPPAVPSAPPVLQNGGKPMTLPFRCTEEDIRLSGLSCSEEEPCPIFLELTAAGQTGNRILAAGNIHTESVTIFGVLLASDDGGHTWAEAADRVRGAGLDHIQFFDPETGWIIGQELFPIPQNPFLLVTEDGGKTWRQRAIFNENSESRFGSIQQFALSGKKDGSLVIDRGRSSSEDRYVLFESPDGGDTWTIKQESGKPLSLKNAAVPGVDWRIRTDGPTKSFHVEHRQGTRWTSVGAFSVKLDSCKPPPPAGGGD
jgi:photosystem II stability/assembly factor-like uncharacterized protein